MSTLIASSVLIPYARAAKAAGLESWALQRLEPARFRIEENLRQVEGRDFLTVAGVRALAVVLKAHGYPVRAHELEVLANQTQSTPSRELIRPAAKDTPVQHPAWMDRADLK